jgi:hypothetical protein
MGCEHDEEQVISPINDRLDSACTERSFAMSVFRDNLTPSGMLIVQS